MWKQNFMFRHQDSTPLKESENELFHDTDPALDSAGLQLEKFISVWIQGDGRDGEPPTAYTNMYVRTATLGYSTAGRISSTTARANAPNQTTAD